MSKTSSINTKLKRYNGTTYDEIGNVVSIGGPSGSMNPIDATSLTSADFFKEWLPGYLDGGDCPVTLHLDPEVADASNQLLVRGDFTGRVETKYRIVLPTGPYVEFDTLVTTWHPFQIPEEDVVGLEFTLKVTGAPTYADAEV